MICGTMVFEGMELQWRYLAGTRDVEVQVCDGVTGEETKMVIPARAFAASMALALDPDGMEDEDDADSVSERLHALCAGIEFPSNELRWIP